MEAAAAGCEKLKPSGPDFSADIREKPEEAVLLLLPLMAPELVWFALLPKGELDMEVVCEFAGSELALKMGLKRASLAGLKLNSDCDPKPPLWVAV